MTMMKETMKVLFYIFGALILTLSQVYADVCNVAYSNFEQTALNIIERRIVGHDNVKNFSDAFIQLKTQLGDASCANAVIKKTESLRLKLKEKRLETIAKYLKMGIKEEAGRNLIDEYEILIGKNKNRHEFDEAFSGAAVQKPAAINQPAKSNPSSEVPNARNSCTEVLHENDAVNLDNVRNQDSVGWCYAYTAADLLSYKLSKKISAVSLYDSEQPIEMDIKSSGSANGGDIKASIDSYLRKNNGLCLEEDLPSNDFKFCTDRRYNAFLNTLVKVVKEKRVEKEMASNHCFMKDLEAAFPGINLETLVNYSYKPNGNKLIETLMAEQCRKLQYRGIKVEAVTFSTSRYQRDFVMKNLDDLLSKGNVVGIGYDYNKVNEERGEGGHASVVVGRRKNPKTGACEYLVRNSWGKSCDLNEGVGLSCHRKCSGSGCRETGHFWISEERLRPAILGVTYIK